MTPRELIASEIARQYTASADRILTRLRYAGFAVVSRKADIAIGDAMGLSDKETRHFWATMISAADNT